MGLNEIHSMLQRIEDKDMYQSSDQRETLDNDQIPEAIYPGSRANLESAVSGMDSKETAKFTMFHLQKYPESVDNIIGLPPAAYYEGPSVLNKVLSSMPMLQLWPALPKNFDSGEGEKSEAIKLYDLNYAYQDGGWERYAKILNTCGIRDPGVPPIIIAFQNEGPITESWANEYTESMFEQIGNTAPGFIRELRYLTNSDSLKHIVTNVRKLVTEQSNSAGSMSDETLSSKTMDFIKAGVKLGGKAVDQGLGGAAWIAGVAENMIKSVKHGDEIHKIIMGSNIDFPLIWAGSSYTPSYSITVRLANPNPASSELYEERVIRPLIKLLALTVPTSDSSSTYNYPLVCKVNCPGLFVLEAGAIIAADVVKGIDGTDIGYHQRPGTIDVRLTFGDLYSSMLSFISPLHQIAGDVNRPTLTSYINNLRTMALHPNPNYVPGYMVGSYNRSTAQNRKPPSSDVNSIPSSKGSTTTNETSNTRVPVGVQTSYTTLSDLQGVNTIDEFLEQQNNEPLNNPDKTTAIKNGTSWRTNTA